MNIFQNRNQESREARAQRKQLERDLATYNTQADRDDLLAMLDRCDDDQTAELREILTRQAVAA